MRVKIKQRGQEFNSFKEIVIKTVDFKAKTALKLRFYACKTDQHCFQGNWSIGTKASISGQPIKDPRVEEFKVQEPKALAFQHFNSVETFKQAQKEKKKGQDT